ncbi:casein kinase I [Drosophila serrata]|uniref:casein kinase I n=1 Tax=Drosophila serrata TaxID=7274 RepID=UPI000A1CF5E0|nr:casein kinase I [Drosophila serrata]KAH8357975.1 hypothetical protein KR200_011347 [Drosophila serrata]
MDAEAAKPIRFKEVQIGCYKVVRKIACGSFGDIYLAVNPHSSERVAIKVESNKVKHPQLMFERRVYKALRLAPGLPVIRNFHKGPNYQAMVMDLLGPSLQRLFLFCERYFTMKTVLLLGEQMLRRIQYVHDRGFLHRDIKPANFVMGVGTKNRVVYLIDFGLAKKYMDISTKVHIPYREERCLTGTARYASISAHEGVESSRRDDMMSLGYILMYFNRGSLPWQRIEASTKHQQYERILEKKISVSNEVLCEGFPGQFTVYLDLCRGMGFDERPDYDELIRMFQMLRTGLNLQAGVVFDWEMLTVKYHGRQQNRGIGKRVWCDKEPTDDGKSGEPIIKDEVIVYYPPNRWMAH